MFADIAHVRPRPPAGGVSSADLSVLLSQVPLAFTLDFERESTPTTAVLDDPDDALPHYPMVLHRGGWPDGS